MLADKPSKMLETPPTQSQQMPQKTIMQYIEYEPISLDELVVLSKLPVSEIQAQLMMEELNGTLEPLSAGRWK